MNGFVSVTTWACSRCEDYIQHIKKLHASGRNLYYAIILPRCTHIHTHVDRRVVLRPSFTSTKQKPATNIQAKKRRSREKQRHINKRFRICGRCSVLHTTHRGKRTQKKNALPSILCTQITNQIRSHPQRQHATRGANAP